MFGYGLLTILIVLIGLLLALRMPASQTFIAQKATAILADQVGGKMRIGKVKINFVDAVELKDIYVETPNQDTLLYAGKLGVDISVFAFIKQKVLIDEVRLEHAVGRLSQDQSGDFNFQYIIDAFISDKPKDTTSTSAWTIDIGDVHLKDVDFAMNIPGLDLVTYVDALDVAMDELNLEAQIIGVDKVALNGNRTKLQLTPTAENTDTVDVDTTNGTISYPLPDIGWTMYLNSLKIENTQANINLNEDTLKTNELDFAHFKIDAQKIDLKDYRWEGQMMTVDINELVMSEENSGYSINQLAGKLRMDTGKIKVEGLKLNTGNSLVALSAEVTYPEFAKLVQLDEQLKLDLTFNDTRIALADLRTFVPNFEENGIVNPNLKDTLFLDGHISGRVADIEPSDLRVRIGQHTRVNIAFDVQGLPNYETVTANIQLKEIATSYRDLHRIAPGLKLPEGLKQLGKVHLSGNVAGSMANIKTTDLRLTTSSTTAFSGDASARGLPNINSTYFTLDVKQLKTSVEDISAIADIELPAEVQRLQTADYTGTLAGTIYEPDVKGTLTTALGVISMNAKAAFDTAYSDGSYSGHIEVKQFDVGEMLQNEELGKLSISIMAEGKGLDPQTISSTIDADLRSFEFRDYKYTDLYIEGRFDTMQFQGVIDIDDPNLQFDFDGLVSLRDSVNDFEFTAKLDTIDMQALNLSATPLSFSTKIESNLHTGYRGATDLNGKVKILDFIVSDSIKTYRLDSMIIAAFDTNKTQKALTISSPILNAWAVGDFSFAELPRQIRHYINDYIQESTPTDTAYRHVDQELELLITIGNAKPLTNVFVPALELDTAYIKGKFSNMEQVLNLKAFVPNIRFDSIIIGAIDLNVESGEERLNGRLSVDSVHINEDLSFSGLSVNTNMADGRLAYQVLMEEDTGYTKLDIAGKFWMDSTVYLVSLDPQMVLNNETWQITPDNEVAVLKDRIQFKNLVFNQNTQEISLRSKLGKNNKNPLTISFTSFKISELSELIHYGGIDLEGTINGKLTLNDIRTNMDFTSDLELFNIRVNDTLVGNLMVDAISTGPNIDLNVELTGTENDLEIKGSIDTEAKYLDVDARIKKLKLSMLDPFLDDFIRTSEGYIGLQAKIKGDVMAPNVDGVVSFHNVNTKVIPAGERYGIRDNKIKITHNKITINNFQLLDKSKNELTIDGSITHKHFQDIVFDLQVKTKKFSMMNTSRKNNQTLYGKIVLAVDASLKGPLELPRVEANVKTHDGTEVYLEPLSFETTVNERDYVIFYNPRLDSMPETGEKPMKPREYKIETSGIDLALNFELTDDAKLQIIIDPLSGDSLTTYGNANLTVNIPPSGDIEILGTYTIDRGEYRLSYQSLVRKRFPIQKGSSILFTGDPLNARLDITAVYTTKATTYDLIASEVAGIESNASEQSKRPQDVDVLLSIRGQLSEPEINFDIRIPGGNVTSTVERKLAQIRQDQTELNKQAFGLLVLNSFIPQEQTGNSSLSQSGSNLALKSASRLITQQLNKLTNKTGRVINIDFNVDSYQSKYETETGGQTVTEVGLQLSRTFFNDRLEVSAGSDVNMQSNTGQEGSFTQVAGDFVIEYKLTESGKYRVKIFNSTDYDVLNQANENRTGVGVTYTESFSRLYRNKKEKEDKEKDTPQEQPAEQGNKSTNTKQEDDEE